MSLPSWVKTGTVSGLTSLGGGGTAVFATGSYIEFVPAITHLTKADRSDTFVLTPQIGYVGDDGDIHPATGEGAWDPDAALDIVATTGQTGTAGEVWYWVATPWVNVDGVRRPLKAFAFNVAADATTSVGSQWPIPGIPPSSGFVKGDTGPPPNLTVGTVSTLAPGDDVSFEILGTTPDYVVDVGIPQGEPGAGGGVDPTDVGFDVILLAGQSNMVSHGTGTTDSVYLDPGDPRIKQYGGSTPYLDQLISGIDPLYHHEQRPGTVGHAMGFARNYLRTVQENRAVLLVPVAHSSTGFTTSSLVSPPVGYTNAPGGGWDTTGGQGGINLYEFAIAQANFAMAAGPNPSNNRIVGVLWLQGEADAGALTQSQYATKLDLLIAGFRSRITGASVVPFLVGQMLPGHVATHSDFQAIQAAHIDTASRNERCAFYYGPAGTQYANSTDSTELHYNNAGQRLLGDSSWSAFALAKANVVSTPPVAPAAVALQQSGTSVIATLTRSAGRVTDYLVEHRANGGSWSTFSHTATLDVTFTITGFALGDVVDVRISTVNAVGTSSPTSASVTLVHLPNSPTLGSATHTATSISPVWTAAGSGDPATSFLVEAKIHGAGSYTSSVTVAGSATTGQVTGLLVDTSYDYRVTPINAAGSGTAVTGTVSTDPISALLTDVPVASFRALSVARKLNSSYAGNCIKVRRSSDNTTQNIGFDGNGDMDVAALLTFCGSGDGFLDTLYDQSSNTRDMTQTTATLQPKIVTAGVVITRNGRPAAVFDGTDDCMDSTVVGLYAAGAATLLAVCELDSSAVASNHLLSEGHNTSGQFALYSLTRCVTGGLVGGQITNDAGTNQNLSNGTVAINTSAVVQLSCVDTGTQEANWVSGAVSRTLTTYTARSGVLTLNRARIGGLVNHQAAVTSPWKGALQESVTFTSALSDPNRQAGELNQKSYYAIA